MQENILLVLILSAILGLINLVGKFWVYDEYTGSKLNDTIKIIYFFFDTLKDLAFLFFLLRYLLYGTIF